MYRYKGVVMTPRIDANGNAFSFEALKQIIQDQPTVPVRLNFTGDPIGSTTGFSMREDYCVIGEFELRYPNFDQLAVFVVPGGKADLRDIHKSEDGKVTIIERLELTELSITTFPADQSLTAIQSAIQSKE